MSSAVVPLDSLAPERRARFKALTATPAFAWPALSLWVLVMTVYVGSDVLAFMGRIPLWAGMLANSLIGYLAFTVTHDAIHRSISRTTWFNDAIGQTTVFIGAPYVDLRLFRWAHIRHHRYANSRQDPDWVLHGAAWTLPLRWMAIDLLYLVHALKHGDAVSWRYLKSSFVLTAITATVFGWLVANGCGWHVLMLWFVPSRLIFLMLGFSFFWLPHVPHDTPQERNFTMATTVRLGHEWLLAPLLQCQHVHLMHHLFPMTPFHRNGALWRLLEPELRRKDLSIQHGFAIRPVRYLAGGIA